MPYRFIDMQLNAPGDFIPSLVPLANPGTLARAIDPAMGGAEFMYVNVLSSPIGLGEILELGSALDATGKLSITAIPWAGAANSGKKLAINTLQPTIPGQAASSIGYGWVQVQGLCLVNTTGVVAVNDRAFFAGVGAGVQTALVASKQAMRMACATLNNATINGYGPIGAQKAVYMLNYPQAQGSIT